MVQLDMSTDAQLPLFKHCLPMLTPERKLGCSSEQGWWIVAFLLLLLQNKPPEKSSSHANKWNRKK